MYSSKEKKELLFIYIIGFFLICFAVIAYMKTNDLMFGREGSDAINQHYPAFLYIGKYYRSSFSTLFNDHQVPALWDFSIGYGSDILNTLTYYSLFDCFTVVFSVFANENNGTLLYSEMILFKVFISGLFFIFYCIKMNCSRLGTLCGSFAYIFSTYSLDCVINSHHFFSHPLIYLPLIMILCERIFRKQKVLYFIPVIALSVMGSVYFFYMEMVVAAVYLCVRCCFYENHALKLKELFALYLSFAFTVLMGLLLAAPVICPFVYSLLTNPRLHPGKTIPVFYSLSEYRMVLGNLISTHPFSYYSYFGVSACILQGVFFLFLNKKEYTGMKILWGLSFLSMLIPALGFFMNGFTYVANRHSWILMFMTVLSFALLFDKMLIDGCKKNNYYIYILLYILYLLLFDPNLKSFEIPCGIVLLLLGLFLICYTKPKIIIKRYMMAVLVFAGILLHIYVIFIVRGDLKRLMTKQQVSELYYKEFDESFSYAKDDESYWRMDWNSGRKKPNSLNNIAQKGSTFSYWSFQNPYLTYYLDSNGFLQTSLVFDGLYTRPVLQSLLAGKYVTSTYKPRFDIYEKNNESNVYINKSALPLAILYDKSINDELYKDLTFAQKQMYQVFGCFVDDLDAMVEKIPMEEIKSYEIPYTVSGSKNFVRNNTIYINDLNEPIRFDFQIKDTDEYELLFGIEDLKYSENDDVYLTAECSGSKRNWNHYSESNRYYYGKNDYLFYFGYRTGSEQTINLSFNKPGIYSYSRLTIESVPWQEIKNGLNILKEKNNIIDLDISINNIKLNTHAEQDSILHLSVPYSSGWTVLVDGVPQKLLNTNIMGIGVYVPAGFHSVQLNYITPGLKFGVIIAACADILFAVLLIIDMLKIRNKSRFKLFGYF